MAKIFILDQQAKLEEFFNIKNKKYDEHDFLFSVEHKDTWSSKEIKRIKDRHQGVDTFSIAERFSSTPHWHMDAEQRLILSGMGYFFIPTKEKFVVLEVESGDLIWLSPGLQHWFDTTQITAVRFFEFEKNHVEEKNNLTTEIETMYNLLNGCFNLKI